MPIFFDENKLSDEQEARYEEALTQYNLIQEANADKQKELLKNIHKLTPRLEKEIDILKQYHKPTNKSSLFFRLLEGKKPLAEPPPTNFSYPWYEVIEEEGPWTVVVGGVSTLDSYLNIPFFSKKQQFVAINQCFWAIRHTNKAGKKFLKINNPAKTREIQAIIEQKPEFIVFYHGWPSYILKVGRRRTQGRRESIMKGEFSLDWLGTNPVVLSVQETGEHYLRMEQQKRQQFLQKNPDEYTSFDRLVAEAYQNPMEVPANATDWDWVEAEVDGWILEKIPGKQGK
jgi:hypothetical protein